MERLVYFFRDLRSRTDCDSVDTINYAVTTFLLAIASAFLTGWNFVGKPIKCWTPKHFRPSWERYAEDYCLTSKTYYLPRMAGRTELGTITQSEKDENAISYYQWVGFVLIIQAFFAYAPIFLWRFFYKNSGVRVGAVLNLCRVSYDLDEASRQSHMKDVARFLPRKHVRRDNESLLKWLCCDRYVIFLYAIIKLLFLCINYCNIIFLQYFLGFDQIYWGYAVSKDLFDGNLWKKTGIFPRVTLCDFTIRELGNVHHHTVQCVLLKNIYNEKIFVLFWYWFLLMLTLSAMSIISWLILLMTDSDELVLKYINEIDAETASSPTKKQLIKEFVKAKMCPDAAFIVRLIESNHGELVACSLLKAMWEEFMESRRPNAADAEDTL